MSILVAAVLLLNGCSLAQITQRIDTVLGDATRFTLYLST